MTLTPRNPLAFDIDAECERISSFIEEKRNALNREGVVIGLSGGLDSAVVAYLTARSVDREKIRLMYLPDRDSKGRHQTDAQEIAKNLGISLSTLDISPLLESIGVYKLLPLRFFPGQKLKSTLVRVGKSVESIMETNLLSKRFAPKGDSFLAKGNAYGTTKHRMRMVMLYYEANIHNLMVIGAANKTELLTGTFSQWGCDQCADIMPVIHLYRSQLEEVARTLGIPNHISQKPADPDVIPGMDNKEELLGSFQVTDMILHGLENELQIETLFDQYGKEGVEKVCELFVASFFMRQSPYKLDSVYESNPKVE